MNGRDKSPLTLVPAPSEAEFYSRQLRVSGRVLVLGCATGKVALHLAGEGAEVVGVDPSEVMVGVAESLRLAAPSPTSSRLRLLVADLRALRLPDRFDWVLAPQNALGLSGGHDELMSLLATVRHHLRSGGSFAFDVGTPPPRLLSGRAPSAGRGRAPERPLFLPHWLERRQGPDRGASALRRLKVRHLDPEDIDAALQRAGFVARERYGAYNGKPHELGDTLLACVADPG